MKKVAYTSAKGLTRTYKQTFVERAERDPGFTAALLDEAATLILSNEPEASRLILLELVNAKIGPGQLVEAKWNEPSGNPT